MDNICVFKFWNQLLENSFQFLAVYKGFPIQYKDDILPVHGNPIVEIRRSSDHLITKMGILYWQDAIFVLNQGLWPIFHIIMEYNEACAFNHVYLTFPTSTIYICEQHICILYHNGSVILHWCSVYLIVTLWSHIAPAPSGYNGSDNDLLTVWWHVSTWNNVYILTIES